MTAKAWRETTLGDEIELAYGKGLPQSSRRNGNIPVFGSNGVVGFHDAALIGGPGIVVGRKGSVGAISFSKTAFWPIDTTYYVQNPNRHNWPYLYYLLQNLGLDLLNSHSAVPGLNRESAYVLDCLFPEVPEQEKIAAVLWNVQRAIEVEEKLIATARELKRSAMHQLFTRGLRNEPQKETEIGLVPANWSDDTLGNLVEIAYGAQAAVANATDPNIGTPIFTNINITNEGLIDLATLRYFKVPEHQRDRLILQEGDVLFNWRSGSQNHVGKTALFDLDGEYTYSSFILRFRSLGTVAPEFLYYYLTHIKRAGFFVQKRNVSSINSVFNATLAATIPVHFPADETVQREIVATLRIVDRKISVHERKRATLQELFKTLLHKLMTGEIRVADLDIDTSEVAA